MSQKRYDFNNRADVETISKRIRISYRKLSGGIVDVEDAVQEILTRMCEGKHQHSTIDQAVIDYLRERYGGAGVRSNAKKHALESANATEPKEMERLLNVNNGPELVDRLDFDECSEWIGNKIDRGCLGLFYKWGLNEIEIGHLFGFSESRVSQRLQRIQKCIQQRIKTQESRERESQMENVLCQKAEGNRGRMEQVSFERMEIGPSWPMESDNGASF